MPLDECFPKIDIPNSHKLFGIGVLLSLLYGIYQLIITSRQSIWKVKLAIIFGVFITFIYITFLLKLYIGDYRCSTVPNSVSGHTFVNVYFLLVWSFNYFRSGKHKNFLHKIYYYLLSILLCVNCIFTYLGGYHTPRQMIYGVLTAIAGASMTWVLTSFVGSKLSLLMLLIANVPIVLLAKVFCKVPINIYKWNTIWILVDIYVFFQRKDIK